MESDQQAEATIAELRRQLAHVESRLRECEERYRAAFEYTGTAMMIVEEDTTISMANHRVEEITGYPQEEGMNRRHSWTEFVAPEEVHRLMQYHVRRRQDPASVPSEYEFRLRRRDGEIRDILMNVSMIPNSNKSLISLIDITSRKRAERALAESERKFRELFENATDLIYTHDMEGNFTSCNTVAQQTYGYTREEMLALNYQDIVHPKYVGVARRHLLEKLQGKEVTGPYELLTHAKNGEEIWVEVSTRLIKDAQGKPVGVQGIGRNITDRKRAELNFEESERRFRETADLLPSVITDLDFDLRVTYVNKRGIDLFGYTMDDIRHGVTIEEILSPDELIRAKTDINNALTPGNYTYGTFNEYTVRKKDGSQLDVLANASPLMKDGKVSGVRICLIDITERKRIQEQLRRSEEKFRGIFAHSPAGIALFNAQRQITDMNDSFAAMFQVAGDRSNFSLELHIAISDAEWRSVMRGGVLQRETQTNQNGRLRYFDWRMSGIGSSGSGAAADLVLAQVQDVTERRVAEELKLRRATEAADKANRLVEGLRKEIAGKSHFERMVSRSPLMQEIFNVLPEMAQTQATVLITGESGTGKELIAHSLHELGPRKDKPFVAINCGALPDTLLESELFGYKAGAFTDAKKDKPGKFALAQGGTIFLDEIGDVSLAVQVKLLRVLQERTYEPLGGVHAVTTDARVVAATNKDLSALVKAGQFREDLYYRLRVLTVKLPPLRDRRCDVPILCDHFVSQLNVRYRRAVKGISDEALSALLVYSFPGNIRELENIIEHSYIFCKSETIDVHHLPREISGACSAATSAAGGVDLSTIRTLEELEKIFLRKVITECGGSKLKAAQRLGIHKTTLFRKLRQLGIGEKEIAAC